MRRVYFIVVVLLAWVGVRGAAVEVGEGREPQMAADTGGRVYLAYGRGNEIHCAVSEDGGRSFGRDGVVANPPALYLGMRRGPRVVAGEGFVLVTAVCGTRGRGRDGDLLAWRSTDGGRHWTGPAKVNDVDNAAREGLAAVACDGGRRVYAVWLDLRTGRTRIVGSLSRDGGLTWEGNEVIYESPDGHVCECCHPSAAFLPDGRVAVMFRNWLGGDRDMYLATFRPGAAAADGVKVGKLGTGSWKLNACPMDGGALAVDGAGEVVAVWQRAGKVYMTRGGGGGAAEEGVGDGVQGWVAMIGGKAAVVWTSGRTGKLFYRPAGGGVPVQVAGEGTDPVLISSGDRAICGWSAGGKVVVDVMPGGESK